MSGVLPIHDGNSKIIRRGVVVIACVEDEAVKAHKRHILETNPDLALYKDNLPPSMANDIYRCFETEPVGIYRKRAHVSDMQRFGSNGLFSGMRGTMQTIQVPVVYNANGFKATAAWEIDQQVSFLGFSDMTGRDSGKGYLNCQIGGTITPHNSGPYTIYAGDYVMFRTPMLDETISAWSGDLANTRGRKPFITVPYHPEDVNLLNRKKLEAAIDRLVSKKIEPGKFVPDPKRTYVENLYDMAVYTFLHEMYPRLNSTDFGIYKPNFGIGAKVDVDAAPNRFDKIIVAIRQLEHQAKSQCRGQAMLTAKPGQDFDMYLGTYH